LIVNGWLIDLYPVPEGMTLWVIDENRQRRRLIDRSFRPCFYAVAPEAQLSALGEALKRRMPASCAFVDKCTIWDGRGIRALEICLEHPTQFAAAVRFAKRSAPSIQLFNSDLMLPPVYCWSKGVFPLARIEAEVDPPGAAGAANGLVHTVTSIRSRDDEWATRFELPPLVIMSLRLEGLSRINPTHGRRGALEIQIGVIGEGDNQRTIVLDDSDEPAVASFGRLLRVHDPDLILSEWGDSTLLPAMLREAKRLRLPLSLNRDTLPVEKIRARSYSSYGRILFKESATTLFGRLHVDTRNSFIAGQCDLGGLWELVRVTKLPIQYASRTTTGTGISYMQMELAYHDGVLIPAQKAEPESPKHPDELLVADRGGLVFPPRLGFHENVAELDFVSEYPSIMARFNISPETVNCACCPEGPRVPELGYRVCQRRRGITSRVVECLIEKRQAYKSQAQEEPEHAGEYKRRRDALKWLLVCCFGYTGYKNARFGKIEAHEAINAMAREKLLVAKETAEEQGYEVLHALVDSLYVRKQNAAGEDYARLAGDIQAQTGLPLAVEAVYRYVVFLPSRQDPEIPVPNRFFCVSTEGELKIRGLECRRHDTPPIVTSMQHEVLAILAEARDFESYCAKLSEAEEVCQRYLSRLADGEVRPEELVVSKRLTRSPGLYQKNSLTAIAARQLDRAGVHLRRGENVDYIICRAGSSLMDDRVRAWTLWEAWRGYDVAEYREAVRKAFEPFSHSPETPPSLWGPGPVEIPAWLLSS
jgi:DNA polymerase II